MWDDVKVSQNSDRCAIKTHALRGVRGLRENAVLRVVKVFAQCDGSVSVESLVSAKDALEKALWTKIAMLV